MVTNKHSELQQLASMHIDGDLDSAGLQRLESLLAGDKDAQAAYIQFVTTHSDLTLLSTYGIPSTGRESSFRPVSSDRNSAKSSGTGRSWLSLGILPILSVVGLLALGLFLASSLLKSVEPSVSNNSTEAAEFEIVARIVRKIDCDWEGDRWALDSSSNVHAGQTLMMRRGLMELEFTSGAIVTLEGPVAFTAETPMNGFLSQGKLTTYVPESAHGFTVDTPGTQTVDLGTEFGLFVGEDGITETHVFDGEVIVKPTFDQQNQQEILLKNDMAIRTEGKQQHQTVSTLSAVPARFAHRGFDKKIAVPSPVIDRGLSLWFSAQHLVQVDEENRVRAWGDIESGSNKKSEVAWQVDESKRPSLIENAIGNQPAVRFSKKTLLVTEPVELAGEQSIGAVFRIDSAAMKTQGIPAQNGRQLINLNGPPHLSLRINDRFQLTSQNFAGTKKTKQGKTSYLTVGRLKHKEALSDDAVVVLSVYNPTKNLSQLFINGILVDQAKAPPMKATKSPRYLGSHMFLPRTNFIGDIAELFVYDTALSDKEVSSLSKSLIEKYGIAVKKNHNADNEKLDAKRDISKMKEAVNKKEE